MAQRILGGQFERQPQIVAGIDRSTELGRRLRYASRLGPSLVDIATGQVATNNGSTITPTAAGLAREFIPASSQFITLPTRNIVSGYPLTVAAWMRVDPSDATGYVAYSLNGTNYNAILGLSPAAGVWSANIGSSPSSTQFVATTGWQHVTCVHRSGSWMLYINGKAATSAATGTNWGQPAAGNHSIGNRLNGSTPKYWDGLIQDIYIFEGELSPAQVFALYEDHWQVLLATHRRRSRAVAAGTTTADIAGTDGADSAAIAAANWTTAQIACTDGADTAGVQATVTTGSGITGTDGADNAVVAAANWTTAQIAGTDGPDSSSITASVDNSTSAAISATDGGDAASVYAANWTTALLAAVDGADAAAIGATVTTGAAIAGMDGRDAAALVAGTAGTTSAGISATEGADIVAIGIAGATGPLILAGSMRHAASLSSSARLATTLRGSIAHV